ncbi:MAG: ABC transporter ATP-binding protein [Terriglobia bacterium]
MSPTPAITVQAVSKKFRDDHGLLGWRRRGSAARRIVALNGITLEVASGEVFGLVGPNGAGKTTLLKILATLVLPDQGAARVGGFDVVREPRETRRRLGVMLEVERSFYARLSGRQNLEFFAALYALDGPPVQKRIAEVLERVGLAEVADRRFVKYSVGMQHRLGLSRALLPEPPVLLLDEPTRSLDPMTAVEFRRLLRDQLAHRQGKTILLASHSLAEVEQLCDRLAVLDRGEIVALGSRDELKRQFQSATLEEVYRKAVSRGESPQPA